LRGVSLSKRRTSKDADLESQLATASLSVGQIYVGLKQDRIPVQIAESQPAQALAFVQSPPFLDLASALQ
jgi:hypothetical protein